MIVRRWAVAGVLFAVIWVFTRGSAVTPSALAANFLVGLAVGLPVAYVFRRLYLEEFDVTRSITTVPYAVRYVAIFLKEILVANVDVTYRVLAPGMPLEPQVILVPLRVETDLGVTTIANSISLTPGTVTLDHDPDRNALYVHGIDGRDPAAMAEPIRLWEDLALVIFDEEASPDDPAPPITVHPPGWPPEPKVAAPTSIELSDADGSDGAPAETEEPVAGRGDDDAR